jgi:hypothetical protein
LSIGIRRAKWDTVHIEVELYNDILVTNSPSHHDIRVALAPLQNLKRLAVFGDEYVADRAGPAWSWCRFFFCAHPGGHVAEGRRLWVDGDEKGHGGRRGGQADQLGVTLGGFRSGLGRELGVERPPISLWYVNRVKAKLAAEQKENRRDV